MPLPSHHTPLRHTTQHTPPPAASSPHKHRTPLHQVAGRTTRTTPEPLRSTDRATAAPQDPTKPGHSTHTPTRHATQHTTTPPPPSSPDKHSTPPHQVAGRTHYKDHARARRSTARATAGAQDPPSQGTIRRLSNQRPTTPQRHHSHRRAARASTACDSSRWRAGPVPQEPHGLALRGTTRATGAPTGHQDTD